MISAHASDKRVVVVCIIGLLSRHIRFRCLHFYDSRESYPSTLKKVSLSSNSEASHGLHWLDVYLSPKTMKPHRFAYAGTGMFSDCKKKVID